jgi:hypothetical protein
VVGFDESMALMPSFTRLLILRTLIEDSRFLGIVLSGHYLYVLNEYEEGLGLWVLE